MNAEAGPKSRKGKIKTSEQLIEQISEKSSEGISEPILKKGPKKVLGKEAIAPSETVDRLQPELAAGDAIAGLSRAEIVAKFKTNPKDCGSPEVQVALITNRLQQLSKHFDKHVADRHSKRGMLQLISKRKGLLQYLNRESPQRYRSLISELGLRK